MTERFDAPGLSRTPGYSHAAASSGGRLVLTAGAVPLDADGNPVGPGDPVAQARQVLDNLGQALEAAGVGWGTCSGRRCTWSRKIAETSRTCGASSRNRRRG